MANNGCPAFICFVGMYNANFRVLCENFITLSIRGFFSGKVDFNLLEDIFFCFVKNRRVEQEVLLCGKNLFHACQI